MENPWKDILLGGEIIIHLAAETTNKSANKNPINNWKINVKPIYDIAEASSKLKKKPYIIFASTVTVFGVTDEPIDESYHDNPSTIYDFHKYTAEKLLQYYNEKGIIKHISLRFSNIYGPSQQDEKPDRGILNKSIKHAIQGNDLTIYKNGKFIRDFIHIKDVIFAILMACKKTHLFKGKKYIISSGNSISLKKTFEMVKNEVLLQLNVSIKIKEIPQPPDILAIEKRNFIGSNLEFVNNFDWYPSIKLSSGIRELVNYYSIE